MDAMKAGFIWTIETLKDGQVVGTERVHNLVPVQGLNYIIEAALRGSAAFPTFYVGLYEGAYAPVPGDTMATFPTAATELTAYAETTRPALVLAQAANGAADSSASKASFTGNTNGKLVQGGFVSSAPTKGAGTGVLVSAVRFPSPKSLDSGTILRITCGFNIVSL